VISAVLEASGSSLAHVVNARIYVTNAGYYDAINGVWARFFPVDPPSRTFVTVGSWFNAFDIEIEVVALEGSQLEGS
jgi:enamine deaminase RidA (YjgF/YER057c/UK114 family)